MSSVNNPLYATEGTLSSVPLLPPVYMRNVTTRVLPLAANINMLQNLVDRYANILPPQVGRFQVMVPYTYLMLLHYGALAEQVADVGWMTYYELMFAIPAAWWRKGQDGWQFHSIVWLSPYIFVQNDFALILGRQVYGWPKLRLDNEKLAPLWMVDPEGDTLKASFQTPVFPQLYAGNTQAPGFFLGVEQAARGLNLSSDIAPWSMMGNAAADAGAAGRLYLSSLDALGDLPGNSDRRPDVFFNAATRLAEIAEHGGFTDFNMINLKQFRQADRPERYCYQSLTAGAMRFTGVNAAGPLGGGRQLMLDESGGYRVVLAKWPQLPIIEQLGLRVERTWRGEGVDMAELRPTFPFWYDIEMTYMPGRNLAWRSYDEDWITEQGGRMRRVQEGVPRVLGENVRDRFNACLPDTLLTVAGPFDYPDSCVNIIPLEARREQLDAFLELAYNQPLVGAPGGVRFEAASAEVYLVVTAYGAMSSAFNDVGNWQGDQLVVFVPVVRVQGEGAARRVEGFGLVPAMTLVSTTTAVISQSEVLGWSALGARFSSPERDWVESVAEDWSTLLSVSTQVFPALGQGQKLLERQVVEIRQRRDELGKRYRSEDWRAPILQACPDQPELQDKLRAWLEGGWLPPVYTLKQFRDVGEPSVACYQSLVEIPRRVDGLHRLIVDERPVEVSLSDYPTQRLVSSLGIVCERRYRDTGSLGHVAHAPRSYLARVRWHEALGRERCYRVEGTEWRPVPS